MTTPAVSVVVPTRGRQDLLSGCVDAIVGQDYAGPIECLVVSDGHPDDVVSLPPARQHRSVRLLHNNRQAGPAGARNTALLASTGEYVAFCDDDDRWRPDKVTRQVAALDGTPGVSAVAGGVALHHRNGRVDLRVAPKPFLGLEDLLRTRPVHLHMSAVLCRRELCTGEVGLFDECAPGSYGEDYDWLLRLAAVGPIRAVPDPVVDVAWSGGSWFMGRWDLIAEAISYLLSKHPEFRHEPRGLARLQGRLAYAHACQGNRTAAWRWAGRALSRHPFERRAYLALLVTAGVPGRLITTAGAAAGRGL